MPDSVVPADPAVYGDGLSRLLDAVAERMSVAEVAVSPSKLG
jgi:hypothetical protein